MKSRICIVALALAMVCGARLLAEDAIKPEDAKCPISGKPCKADKSVTFEGGKVYFCCGNCPKAFEADSAKFAAKARQQMVQTGELEQVHCPISHQAFKADKSLAVGGATVKFCCDKCKGKVEAMSADDQVAACFAKEDCFKAAK